MKITTRKKLPQVVSSVGAFLLACKESGRTSSEDVLTSIPDELLTALDPGTDTGNLCIALLMIGMKSLESPSDPGIDEDDLQSCADALSGAASLERLRRTGMIDFQHPSIFVDVPVRISLRAHPDAATSSRN